MDLAGLLLLVGTALVGIFLCGYYIGKNKGFDEGVMAHMHRNRER